MLEFYYKQILDFHTTKMKGDHFMILSSKKSGKLWKEVWGDRYIYLMILPVVVYFAIFKYWPMGWLVISLYDYKLLAGFGGSKFVGLKHFINFFSSTDSFLVISNTLLLNLYALISYLWRY